MAQLEGKQSVLAALAARQRRFEVILVNQGLHEDKIREVLEAAAVLGVPIKKVAASDLDSLAHGGSHGGVLAVCSAKPRMTFTQLAELLDRQSNPLLLLLEGVDDARNLGFTLRSAEALGATAVLIKKHLWDFDEAEIARPASGAFDRLPLLQLDEVDVLQKLQGRGLKLLGCLGGARQSIHQAQLSGPVILAIGGEKRGLSGAVRAICDGFVSVPTQAGAASLPLSHAAAIVLAEARRQRLAAAVQIG